MQEDTLVTADNDFCQLSTVPDNIKAASMEANAEVVSNFTENTIIPNNIETVVYGLKLVEEELDEKEKEKILSPSMKKACGEKPIVKTTVKKTSENIFKKMKDGEIVDIPQGTAEGRRLRRQTQCANVKVRK